MSCGLEPPNETLNEVKLRIRKCSFAHDTLKSAIKSAGVPKKGSFADNLTTDDKERIRRALLQSEKAHREFKDFFRQYYSNTELQELFPEEVIKQKYNKLKQEHARLREHFKIYENQARDLQKDEQKFKNERETFLQQKTDLEETLAQLQKRCEELEDEQKDDGLQFNYKRKHQQLEQTLKAQNELIDDLERRLSACQDERENFRKLNKILEVELRKRRENLVDSASVMRPMSENLELSNQASSIFDWTKQTDAEVGESVKELEEKNDQNDLAPSHAASVMRPISENLELSKQASSIFDWTKQTGAEVGESVKELGEENDQIDLAPSHTPREVENPSEPPSPTVLQPPLLPNVSFDAYVSQDSAQPSGLQPDEASEPSNRDQESEEHEEGYSAGEERTKQLHYIRESLEKISKIGRDAAKLEKEVGRFSGNENSGTYLHIKKLILGNLIKLDDIDADVHQIVKQRKREEVRNLMFMLNDLKSKCIS